MPNESPALRRRPCVFSLFCYLLIFFGAKKKSSGRGGGIGWEMINLSPGGEGLGGIGCDPVRRPKKSASPISCV